MRGVSLLEKIYLKPGDLVVAEKPVMVTTVLGSCISVTMFHPQTGIAAICHAMMPDGGSPDSFKYVDSVIHCMVLYFRQRKIPREEIQVKVFGGADMFNCIESNNSTVSRRNVIVATRCLHDYGLIPAVSDLGGKEGRKLIFRTDSGAVFLKKLHSRDWVCCVGGIENK